MQETRENARAAAIATIIDMWSCIDWDKVDGKRAIGIWDEVSNKVKAASMTTTSYEKFIEKLARKLDIRSLRYRDIADIEKESQEFKQAILKLFREETLSIMLEVRLNNQIRKEQMAQEKERQEKIKTRDDKLNNTQVSFTEKGVIAHEN
jgi:hypothetical protein